MKEEIFSQSQSPNPQLKVLPSSYFLTQSSVEGAGSSQASSPASGVESTLASPASGAGSTQASSTASTHSSPPHSVGKKKVKI